MISSRDSSHTPMPSPTASATVRGGTRRIPRADGARTRSARATATAAKADRADTASSTGAPGNRPVAATSAAPAPICTAT